VSCRVPSSAHDQLGDRVLKEAGVVPSTDTEPSRRFPDTSKTIGAPERRSGRQSSPTRWISASAKRTLPRRKSRGEAVGRRKPNALRRLLWCCDLLGLDDARSRTCVAADGPGDIDDEASLAAGVSRAATGFFGPLLPADEALPRATMDVRRHALGVATARLPSRATGSDRSLHFVTWKPDQPAVWDDAVRRFESEHPGITVVREVGPHSSTAFHDLVTQKLKNRDPGIDVFFVDVVWLAEFAAAGWALPVDDRFTAEDRADFLAGTIRASTWKGRLYGVPAFVDAGMLYYRKDLLEKYRLGVPATWEELETAARHVVTAEKRENPDLVGYSGQFKQYEGLVCDLLEFVTANGGSFVDESGARATLGDERTLAAIRWVRDRVIGDLAPRSELTYQEPESLALFLQGLAVFHRNWPYAWDVANDERQSRVAGKVGMAPLPHFAGWREPRRARRLALCDQRVLAEARCRLVVHPVHDLGRDAEILRRASVARTAARPALSRPAAARP